MISVNSTELKSYSRNFTDSVQGFNNTLIKINVDVTHIILMPTPRCKQVNKNELISIFLMI